MNALTPFPRHTTQFDNLVYVCTAEGTISFKEIHAKTEKPFLIMTIAIILP